MHTTYAQYRIHFDLFAKFLLYSVQGNAGTDLTVRTLGKVLNHGVLRNIKVGKW